MKADQIQVYYATGVDHAWVRGVRTHRLRRPFSISVRGTDKVVRSVKRSRVTVIERWA